MVSQKCHIMQQGTYFEISRLHIKQGERESKTEMSFKFVCSKQNQESFFFFIHLEIAKLSKILHKKELLENYICIYTHGNTRVLFGKHKFEIIQ